MEKKKILILLIVGLAIVAFSYPMNRFAKTSSNVVEETLDEKETYEKNLETRLANTLSRANGIGKVKVMVTLKNESNEETSRIEGVVVIAQGADENRVKTEIYETVQALFGVPLHKIKVLKGDL